MKRMSARPAVLGGVPSSPHVIPVSSPTLLRYGDMADGFRDVITSGIITRGPHLKKFERQAAAYLGVRDVVGVSSNTAGLLLVLKALGLKGQVIVPSFTFSVTGHVLSWNNLEPVFVDIDPKTCVLDPADVEKAINVSTCAILGVHVWGIPCPVRELEALAARHGLVLIFDSAQAMGSRYNGHLLGRFGRAEVFSCSPTKLLTSCEGGLVATNDPELARLVRVGRNYGDGGTYDCEYEGLNARMSELHAVVGLSSFGILRKNLKRRKLLADRYIRRLRKLPGIRFPEMTAGGEGNCVYFSILVEAEVFGLTADELHAALQFENIDTRRYYSPPLHRQKVNAALAKAYEGRLPNTEQVVSRNLTLPMYSHMSVGQVDAVCRALERLHSHREAVRPALTRYRNSDGWTKPDLYDPKYTGSR